jgi:hypothetical protein
MDAKWFVEGCCPYAVKTANPETAIVQERRIECALKAGRFMLTVL